MFKKQNKTGKKEFGLSTDVQDFRIMATAILHTSAANQDVFVAFGTSSGQLILEKLSIDETGKF